jgi:hypothetical protein
MENPPLSLPDMYFVIDESESMEWIKDSNGAFCDASRLRYEIPLFIAQILKNWVDQGVANVPNLYLFLSGEQANANIPSPIAPDLMIATLKYLLSNPTKSSTQPFDAAFGAANKMDALQSVFSTAKDNDSIFLFTDGDFRKLHPGADSFDSNANSTSIEVAGLFQNKPKSFKTFSFLLCTRSIESVNNRFIKDTWKDINDEQDIVYGIEFPDLSDKTVLSDTVSKMLSDWLGDWNKSGNGYMTRGAGWLAGENIAPINNVTPDLLRLRYGAISFETGNLNMKVQVDGNPAPELDISFPESIDDFIPPTGQCGPHSLAFDFNQPTPIPTTDHVFYWWWADTPKVYVYSGQPLVLYNNTDEDYVMTVRVNSSLKNNELLKNNIGNNYNDNDMNNFSRCLQFFLPIGGKDYPLVYTRNGNLQLKINNPFASENDPLPNGTGVVPVTFWGVWNVDQKPSFSIESQNTQIVKVRYYPVVGSKASPTPGPGDTQVINLQISLDFFQKKYYSQSIFPNESWKPIVKFAGNGCPPILTKPVEPPYPPSGGPAPLFDVKTIQADESGLVITVQMDSTGNLAKCDQLILSWDKWPFNDDWQKPLDIKLTCGFKNVWDCSK